MIIERSELHVKINFSQPFSRNHQNIYQIQCRSLTLSSKNPEQVKTAFEELGPTFIKIGQMLSVRDDLLSTKFTKRSKPYRIVSPK